MKKQILSSAAALFLTSAIVLTGCKKEDTNAPTITLKGDAEMVIYLNDTYTEPGATATDLDGKDKESDVSSKIVISGTVDKTKAGAYTITYNVTDDAGNAASEVKRTVKVKQKASTITGSYSTTESCNFGNVGAYSCSITTGTTGDLSVVLSNFGNYQTTVNIPATLSGDFNEKITLESGTYAGLTMSGSGTIEPNGKKITISYTAGTDNCTATWNKQ